MNDNPEAFQAAWLTKLVWDKNAEIESLQAALTEALAREAAAIEALEKLSGWLDRANYSPATEYTTHTHTYSPDERMAEDMRFQGDWQQADELVSEWKARGSRRQRHISTGDK